jgi:aldehyde dehydrogenase (NAD+)
MEDSSRETIENLLKSQKAYFSTNASKDLKFRIENLKKFKAAILKYEKKITEALWIDLHKSYEEAYLTEISIVKQEIDNHISHLKRWA